MARPSDDFVRYYTANQTAYRPVIEQMLQQQSPPAYQAYRQNPQAYLERVQQAQVARRARDDDDDDDDDRR